MKKRPSQKIPPQCEHIKTNGVRCGSPALRTRRLCYFHQRACELRRIRRESPETKLHIPLLEDANAIQMAIQQVAEAVAEERIDNKRAGLLLFAFQTAANNLKNADFEPKQLRGAEDAEDQLTPIAELIARELGFDLDLEELKDANGSERPNEDVNQPHKKSAASETEFKANAATG